MQKDPRKHDAEETDERPDEAEQSGYYYDDAHGYEEFDPNADDDADDGDTDD